MFETQLKVAMERIAYGSTPSSTAVAESLRSIRRSRKRRAATACAVASLCISGSAAAVLAHDPQRGGSYPVGPASTTGIVTPSSDRPSDAQVNYVFGLLKSPLVTALGEPRTLAESLPQGGGAAASVGVPVSIIVGQVTGVANGEAWEHTGADGHRIVDFDSPTADERNVVMSVQVEESYGAEIADRTVGVRVGLHGGADVEQFKLTLASLGKVIIGLNYNDDGWPTPALSGRFIALVDAAGALTFPALANDGSVFMGSVNTLARLRSAAQSD